MSRRLEILRAQLAARPEWEKTANPLVERHRDTGAMRAVGLTLPEMLKPAAPAADGWLTHTGDACPVPLGASVWVRMRNGKELLRLSAACYSWRTDNGPHDIVAYRVVKPAASEPVKPVKRSGWVMYDADANGGLSPVPADQLVWLMYAGHISRPSHVSVHAKYARWGRRNDGLRVIAYSTDKTCPEWTGEATQ